MTTGKMQFLKTSPALATVAQSVGASSCKPKGHGFDSWSGNMPGLQAWCPGHVQEATDRSFSLPLSKISKHVLGKD